jgi:hypothetical protein
MPLEPRVERPDCLERDHGDSFAVETAFWILNLPWHVLGITDRDQRLSELGA